MIDGRDTEHLDFALNKAVRYKAEASSDAGIFIDTPPVIIYAEFSVIDAMEYRLRFE